MNETQKNREELLKWSLRAYSVLMILSLFQPGLSPTTRDNLIDLINAMPEFMKTEADQFFGAAMIKGAKEFREGI
jgi:hypothetical protein